MSTPITRDEVARRIETGDVTVVEVLPESYYRDGHLPGAVNLPHDEVDGRADEILPDKNAAIIVYCSNGECQNSTIAADRLSELGYANVFDYVEGKQDWVDAGLPTEQHLPA